MFVTFLKLKRDLFSQALHNKQQAYVMMHDDIVTASYSGGVTFYIKLHNKDLLVFGNAGSLDCTVKASSTAVLT